MQLVILPLFLLAILFQRAFTLFQTPFSVYPVQSLEKTHEQIFQSDYLSALLFCSAQNPKCREIESEYIKFADSVKGWMKVYGVDCDLLDRKEAEDSLVCSDAKVDDHPVLVFFQPAYDEDGKKTLQEHLYEGSFEVATLEEFALEFLPSFHQTIKNKEQLTEFLKNENIPNSLLLFVEDSEIPLAYKALTSEYNERIKFGVIKKKTKSLVEEFEVTKFPTILVLKGNKKVEDNVEFYNGKLEIGPLKDFTGKYALKAKVNSTNQTTVESEGEIVFSKITTKNFAEEIKKHEQLVLVHLYEEEPFPLIDEVVSKFQTLFKYYNFSCKTKKAKQFAKENFGMDSFPSLIVYTIGKKYNLYPSLSFFKFNNMVEITKEISDLVPDKTIKVGSHNIQEEITKTLLKKKPFFVLFHDSKDISVSYRVLSQSLAYKDKAVFTHLRYPTKDVTEAFGIQSLPSLIAIFAEDSEIKDFRSHPEYVQLSRFKDKYVFHLVNKFFNQTLSYIDTLNQQNEEKEKIKKEKEEHQKSKTKIQYDEL